MKKIDTAGRTLPVSAGLQRWLADYVSDGVAVLDHEARLTYANPVYRRSVPDAAAVVGGDALAGLHPEDRRALSALLQQVLRDGQPCHAGVRRLARDGELRGFECELVPLPADQRTPDAAVALVLRDQEASRESQRRLQRMQHLYAALSRTNQAIIRIRDLPELYHEICNVAVEYAHFPLVWIGMPDPRSRELRPAASAGESRGYLDGLSIVVDGAAPERSLPVSRAMREGQPSICNDVLGDASLQPHWDRLAHYGFGSIAAFPVRAAGRPCGVLGLYAAERDFFDDELTALLGEMASNISFAIDNQARERDRLAAERALASSELLKGAVLEAALDCIITSDGDGRIIDFNPAAERTFGYLRDEVIGRTLAEVIVPPAYRAAHEKGMARYRATGQKRVLGQRLEIEGLRKNGEIFPVELAIRDIRIDGRLMFTAYLRDITNRKRIERSLRILAESSTLMAGEEFFPSLAMSLASALDIRYAVVAECKGGAAASAHVLALCRDGLSLPGYDYALANTPCQAMLQSNELCYYADDVQAHFPGNAALKEMGVRCYLGLPLNNSAGQPIGHIFVMHDKPLADPGQAKAIFAIYAARAAVELERKQTEDRIRHIAHHDMLTSLPNRTLFLDRLGQAVARANRFGNMLAVMFIDFDRFKNINDTLGHDAGDHALRVIAARLAGIVRSSDTLARVGGDEFMLLIDDLHEPRSVETVARNILNAVAEPFTVNERECRLTASIGVALYPGDGEDAQQLLKNADIAMYRVKDLGRDNYLLYASEMNQHTLERLTIESDLRRALENDELVLYYQPKVSLASGQVTGAEALLRWNHPQFGLLPPGLFIPLAEESGMIVRLGEWVLNRACADLRGLIERGLPALRVAINLSARQFADAQLLDKIRTALDRHGLDASWLELEITESTVMQRHESSIGLMRELKEAGLYLSIDDFGTGYSSLAYLKRFPVDSLKIDRSFIRDIPHDQEDAAIARAVVAMAHSMGIAVIAEGVERTEQQAFLHEIGCDEYQGYWFSPPLPMADYIALLCQRAGPPRR